MPNPRRDTYDRVDLDERNGKLTPVFYMGDTEVEGYSDYEIERLLEDHPWIKQVIDDLEERLHKTDQLRFRYQDVAQKALFHLDSRESVAERSKVYRQLRHELSEVNAYADDEE